MVFNLLLSLTYFCNLHGRNLVTIDVHNHCLLNLIPLIDCTATQLDCDTFISHHYDSIVDGIALVTAPVLVINMHYFWSYVLAPLEVSPPKSHCRLSLTATEDEMSGNIYNYIFTNLPFVLAHAAPLCVAASLLPLYIAHHRRNRDDNAKRRFLLDEETALDFR